MQNVDFKSWKFSLGKELATTFGLSEKEGHEYVKQCGDDTWKGGYELGLSPSEQADEEAYASADCIA